MLISKTVIVKWSNIVKRHYEELGYIFTKQYDEFEVRVLDLPEKSGKFVSVQCDCKTCNNPFLKPMKWSNYKFYVHENGKYYCSICASKLYGGERARLTILERHGKTFEDWCIENKRKDILLRWDYDLNSLTPKQIGYCSGKKYWFKCPKGIHKSELRDIEHLVSGRGDVFGCNQCNSFAAYGIEKYGENFLQDYWSDKNTEDPWILNHSSGIKVWIKCQLKDDHKDYPIICSDFNVGHRCSVCAREARRGEGNNHWKGGISNLLQYLRATISQWKNDTMRSNGFKCVITSKRFDIIHHVYGFDQIVEEILSITKLPVKTKVNLYSQEELDLLKDTCIKLHEKYGLGACLTNDMHNKFHLEYGYGQNTPRQFKDFKENNTRQFNNNITD